MSQKIVPNLWFNNDAKEAVDFYTEAFGDSEVVSTAHYPSEGLPDFQKDMAGKELVVEFRLGDLRFMAINAGPEFVPNPAISFMLNFDPSRDPNARQKLDELWEKLCDGGRVLMPLDKYDFSEHYGWVQDKYGFTWQLILTDPEGDDRPFIVPSLQFGAAAQNKAGEAIDYYISVFQNAKKGMEYPYDQATGPAIPESLMYADFVLENQWLTANDSGVEQDFTFNEAVSFMVNCKDQQEIDDLWSKLSAVPEAEQCGWCKDKFGVSWQIVPENMGELMQMPNAYEKMMQMKKIQIEDFS